MRERIERTKIELFDMICQYCSVFNEKMHLLNVDVCVRDNGIFAYCVSTLCVAYCVPFKKNLNTAYQRAVGSLSMCGFVSRGIPKVKVVEPYIHN